MSEVAANGGFAPPGPAVGSGRADDPVEQAIQSLGVVGVGLIGGSIALAARRAWPTLHVTGVDRGAALDAARFLTAFDAVEDDLAAVRDADLIVLAAPVRQNIAVLQRLAALGGRPLLVTDTGSTKRTTIEAAAALPSRVSFVGGHPLAGAARGGLTLARADLFVGRPWLVTPGPAVRSDDDVRRVTTFAAALGAEPRLMDADTHDRLFAYLSHLPQLAASALMHAVGQAVGDRIDLAGPGLADTTRLASSPAAIWQDICATNADDIRPALDGLIAILTELRKGLENDRVVKSIFESAQRWRERI
jgi:prephenate dehydrogenase